jgi:hypothetical protein
MIDTVSETRCKYCGKPVEAIPGHRPRQYCNAAHRQLAFRARKVQQDSNRVTIVNDSQQRIEQLEQELVEVNQQIERLLEKKSNPKNPMKQSLQARLQRLGESIDYQALEIHVPVRAGQRAWRAFMLDASNDMLLWACVAAEKRQESNRDNNRDTD